MKDDRVYLVHILDCIHRIKEDTGGGREAFFASRTLQDAVLRNLHTLTESVQRISSIVKDAHPEVEWRWIAAFRNVVVHDYLSIDLGTVWDIIQHDVPVLKHQLENIIRELGFTDNLEALEDEPEKSA